MGPFPHRDAEAVSHLIEALQDFHEGSPVRPELRRLHKKEYYIDCDRAAMKQLLQKEDLIEKPRNH